jgi:phosphoribosyl-AMP cyclohydrolase
MKTDDTTLPLRFDDDGLVPVVVVDAATDRVLMVGFMNDEALTQTRRTGIVHFWSRRRQSIWKKGESSGHLQHVREIRVNCDLNSMLIEVDQHGSVCHDGYNTCYYRRLEPDNTLVITQDRQFDPRDVYPEDGVPRGLAARTLEWWAAYEWLRDRDLEDVSGTSKRLRSPLDSLSPRITDELLELAGVLTGSHRHNTLAEDIRLESGQVLYWIACAGVWQRLAWEAVRPDRALDISGSDFPSGSMLASLLTSRAAEIATSDSSPTAPLLHDTIRLVGAALHLQRVDPLELIEEDLSGLRSKPYFSRDG